MFSVRDRTKKEIFVVSKGARHIKCTIVLKRRKGTVFFIVDGRFSLSVYLSMHNRVFSVYLCLVSTVFSGLKTATELIYLSIKYIYIVSAQ